MGVMIDMPVAIVQQANEYAERSGCSFRDLLCLSVEMYLAEQERKRKADASAWVEKFNALHLCHQAFSGETPRMIPHPATNCKQGNGMDVPQFFHS